MPSHGKFGDNQYLFKNFRNLLISFNPNMAPSKMAMPVLNALMTALVLLAAGAKGATKLRVRSVISCFWRAMAFCNCSFCRAMSSSVSGVGVWVLSFIAILGGFLV